MADGQSARRGYILFGLYIYYSERNIEPAEWRWRRNTRKERIAGGCEEKGLAGKARGTMAKEGGEGYRETVGSEGT